MDFVRFQGARQIHSVEHSVLVRTTLQNIPHGAKCGRKVPTSLAQSFLKSFSYRRNSPNFMEPQGSKPGFLQPATCSHPQPDQSSPRLPILLFNKISHEQYRIKQHTMNP